MSGGGVEARSIAAPDYLDPENPPDHVGVLAGLSLRGVVDVGRTLIDGLEEDGPPDVIVHDSFAAIGRVAAEVIGTPRVCNMSLFALTRTGIPVRALPSMITPAAFDPRPRRVFREARRDVRAQFGVDIDGLFDALSNTAPTTLVCTSRGLQPGGERFDDRYRFVGPMLTPLGANADEPALADFPDDGDRPLIYMGLGTLRNDRADLYRLCADVVTDLPVPVNMLMSIGHRVDPGELGALPPNVVARPHVDQRAVLERASIFVTHAGMNSVQEALTAGVPMLCLPQGDDQFIVAERLVQLGAALRGRESARRLRARPARESSPTRTCAPRPRRLGDDLSRTGGATAAAAWSWRRPDGPSFRRPPS